MRQGIRLTPRVSEPQHFSLQPWDLESQQIIILVDLHSNSPVISIICAFVCYEEDENKVTVLVANGLLKYLYPNSDHKVDPAGRDDLITFNLRDVWIHPCTD